MADLLQLALRRKLAAAEAAGDYERSNALRARLGEAAPAAAPEPEPAEDESEREPEGLDDIEFASPAARNAAIAAGLTPSSFWRRKRSGETGFTKADVERIAGTAADDEEPA